MSSDHHHHRGGGGGQRYFKSGDSYVGSSSSSSKRYHSPSDVGGGSSGRGSLGGAGGGGSSSYYEPKRSRSDSATYGAGGSSSYHHTSSASSTRYTDYGSTSGGGGGYTSNRYKTPSSSTSAFYDSGLKSSSSKYIDDYKGRSLGVGVMKSSVRRIPPPPPLSSMSSSKMMKSSFGSLSSSSSSSRPLPLMKVNISSSSSGLGSSGRDSYGGSRLRTAPPEHHSVSSYSYSSSSSSFRKPELKRLARPVAGVLRNPHGPIYPKSSTTGTSSAFKRGTIRAAASVTSKIRRRAVTSFDDRKKRIESYSSSKRESDRSHRAEKRKATESSSRDKKESETKESEGAEKKEVKLPDGEVGVVLDEVGGDSDSDGDDIADKDDEGGVVKIEANKVEENDEAIDAENPASAEHKENQDEKSEHEDISVHDHDHDHSRSRDRDRRRSHDRDSSPSSRALLKLYCKYCDVRHVTFREYSHHLRSFPHIRAMNTAVTDMRKQLSKIRTQQRDEQRRAEKEEKVELSDTTSYCRVCELNFRTDPKEHEANKLHNEIKTMIYQRCDICDIDFRIWKVYLYHMAALEHVKRVAMKELKDAEGKVDGVKGTNLTQEELGADLVEVRTVFFCNACVRYLPIKGDVDEAKERHCMTLTHVKGVEEFRQREKKIAERQRIRMEREEKEKERRLKDKLKEESKNQASGDTTMTTTADTDKVGTDRCDGVDITTSGEVKKEIEEEALGESTADVKMEVADGVLPPDGETMEGAEDQDVDEDEIELHAGDDVPEDEENDQEDDDGSWNRRTRSAKLAN